MYDPYNSLRNYSPTYSTSFSRAQEARDHSEHPDYWLPPEPPTLGDERWEEQFCDKIAENFIKDKGTLPEFKENIGNIAQHITEQREGVIEGYPWEYLAEAWLDADGGADGFLRLHGEIAGWIVSWGAMYARISKTGEWK